MGAEVGGSPTHWRADCVLGLRLTRPAALGLSQRGVGWLIACTIWVKMGCCLPASRLVSLWGCRCWVPALPFAGALSPSAAACLPAVFLSALLLQAAQAAGLLWPWYRGGAQAD